ncbi:SGNH/GDSL hydrolase family protein [Sorangium sp. So ce134]
MATVGSGGTGAGGAGGSGAGSTSSSAAASTAQASSSASGGETVGTGGGSGECVTGQTRGEQVAVIGESFIAATHGITQQIEKQAKANGSLAENERYIDNSVSGTTLANDQIPSQYRKAAENGMIKYVLMDGGGNDCLLRGDGDAALAAAESLFETMAADNVEKVVYFFYPDPIGSQFASLKTCLDALRPKMKELCDGLTSPKCYWLDLRPTWNGHNEYTQDGIHPTSAGSIATGDAVWETMKANCVAQ